MDGLIFGILRYVTTIFGSYHVKYCYGFLWNGIERIGSQTAVENGDNNSPIKL